jgi:hypothetical protein
MSIEQQLQQKHHQQQQQQQQQGVVIHFTKLPNDIITNIFSFLDAKSLIRQRCLNRSFQQLASQCSLWEGQCHYLWKDKVHVTREARDLMTTNTDALAAYRTSLLDATNRHHVTRDELCYDPQTQRGTIWSIRFKESAGK